MKNLKLWVALFVLASAIFTACKNDDSSNKEVFSELTPVENKQMIEDEGVEFVSNISSIANLTSYDVFDQFSKNMDLSNVLGVKAVVVTNLISQVELLKSGSKSTIDLKSYSTSDASESITSMFTDMAGIYTWNSELSDWDEVASDSELTFNFAIENGKKAKLSISEFLFIKAQDQLGEGLVLELPTSIKMTLTLDEATLCSLTVSGTYYEDDMPKIVSETITLEGFNYISTLDLSSKSKLKTNTSFDYDGEVIIATGVEVAGDMNFDAIVSDVDKEDGIDDLYTQQIIDNANAYFQIGNVKAEGLVDFVGMSDDIQGLNEETATEDSFIEILNNNIKTYIRYADSNEIIAKNVFYMYEETSIEWDYDTQQSVEVAENVPGMKMVFADGSSIDGSFFDNGFGKMITSINELITSMNTNYGWSLESIN